MCMKKPGHHGLTLYQATIFQIIYQKIIAPEVPHDYSLGRLRRTLEQVLKHLISSTGCKQHASGNHCH